LMLGVKKHGGNSKMTNSSSFKLVMFFFSVT
jgi:hypothetical protein